MKIKLTKSLALLQIALVALTGCHPTQPFYVGGSGDLSHYIDMAQKIEYPDLQSDPLPEASESMTPYSVDNHDYEFLDLTLEECVSYALVNTKLVRALPGSNQIVGDIAVSILTSPSQQLVTAFDPAITASTANTQAQVVDQNGNRVLPRGASRANQVGGVEDALSEFDAQYSSFAGYNTTDRPRNVGQGNIFNPQFFQANDGTLSSAISKRIATGGVVTARSQTVYSNNNIFTQGFVPNSQNLGRQTPNDYTQILEMQVQHPLMRGRGTMVNRIPVVLARINEDVSIGQYEERVRNLVKEVEIAYWDLYLSYWNVETAKVARDSSLQVWRVASAKYQAGQGQVFAEAQAKAQYHQFEALLRAALVGASVAGSDPGVYGRERRLRHLMGWAATDGRLIRPTDKPNIARTDFDWWTIQGEALTRNIDLRQQKWQIKAREMELISSKNQVLPDVNVSALYRWLGVGDTFNSKSGAGERFPRGPQSATDSLLGGDFQEAALRVEFTPAAFGARRQLASVRNSQLGLARETEVLHEKEIALIHRLSEEVSLMQSHYEQIEIKLNQWSASERDAKAWTDKFEVGDTNLDMILDNLLRSQERRARAQADYYRAVTEYNKSIVQVHLLKGSLLEYNNICLQEGPWAEKAYWDAEGHAKRRDAAHYMDYGASRPRVISQGAYQQHTGMINSQDGIQSDGDAASKSVENDNTTNEPRTNAIPPSAESPDALEPPAMDSQDAPNPGSSDPRNRSEEVPGFKATTNSNRREFRQAGYVNPHPSTPSNIFR